MKITKKIFETQLGIMKNILKLVEFKIGGRESEEFKYAKEQIMNFTYDATKKFYQQGVADGIFECCECGASLRQGWKKCEFCAGSGYKDKE